MNHPPELVQKVTDLLRAGAARHHEPAAEIIDAVWGYNEGIAYRTQQTWREQWEEEHIRGRIRQNLRYELAVYLVDNDLLPLALPVETLAYYEDRFYSLRESEPREIPAELAESGKAYWGSVRLRLEVPVRTPPPVPEPAPDPEPIVGWVG